MKWMILAVILIAQQPVKAPEGKRTTESDGAQSAAHAKPAERKQRPNEQPTPVPPQASAGTESQPSGATTNNNSGTSTQHTSDEDRATQRNLTWFSGILAGVGLLQLLVMFLTWLVYKRQALEMRRSRHEMRRQRHVMFGQYKAMRDQIAQMEVAGKQTAELIKQASTQSGLMALSGTHTEQLANEAARQTTVTQSQLELSQRPWVSVTRLPQALQFNANGAVLGCTYKLENCGGSVAWNVSIWADLVPEGTDWRPTLDRLQGVMALPQNEKSDYGFVLFPKESLKQYQPSILPRQDLDDLIKKDIFKGTGKVGFKLVGCIDYRSHVSPRHYQTAFVDLVGYPDQTRGTVMGAFDPTVAAYMMIILTPHGHGASAS